MASFSEAKLPPCKPEPQPESFPSTKSLVTSPLRGGDSSSDSVHSPPWHTTKQPSLPSSESAVTSHMLEGGTSQDTATSPSGFTGGEPDSIPGLEEVSPGGEEDPSKTWGGTRADEDTYPGHGFGPPKADKAEEGSPGPEGPSPSFLSLLKMYLALTLWLGLFHFNFFLLLISFNWQHPWAVASLALLLFLAFVPINRDSQWGRRVGRFVVRYGMAYFPMKLVLEDSSSLDPSRAYVVAFEPHSILPLGFMALCPSASLFPLPSLRVLGSSALGCVPLCRHIWTWLGFEAVSLPFFSRILRAGTSCALVPGGLKEALLADTEREVLFLRRRKGFVRVAVHAGAPLVPVFAFGQCRAYRWLFPRVPLYHRLARLMLYAPMLFWGVGGSPLPFRHPITVVVGTPIPVSPVSEEEGDAATMERVHSAYIQRIESMYEKYKGKFGEADVPLVVL